MTPSRFETISPVARARRPWRLAAVLLLGGLLVTCTRDLTAPAGAARVVLTPRFAEGSNPPGNALAIDHIRVQVLRTSTEEVVADKTYGFATGASLQLSLAIPLTQPTDTFDIEISYEHGTEVLFSGGQSAVLGQGESSAPIGVPVTYSGPGVAATSLTIGPRDTILTSGDALQFRVTVLDTATPDSVYVGWGTNTAGQAIDPTGRLVATLTRGTITVRAVSPTPPGLRDSTTVRIVPKPSGMVKVSGDGQTGVAGQALPQPLVVQVNGLDNLGVPGVAVTFSVVSGGGSVDTANVVTDSVGRAATTVVLGPGTGAQSFKATAGTLSATFGEAGGAAPPKTWTGAVSTDWATGGNWSPAGVPAITDSVIIPSGTANAPLLHGGAFDVGGLSILSGATLTLDTASLVVNGSFTQAGTFQDPSASSVLLLAGAGKSMTGSWSIFTTTVTGSYALTGNVTIANAAVLGSLTLAGHTLRATGTFATANGSTGVVTMTNATDSLIVQGAALFSGGVETGHLTAGTFVLGGNFGVSVHSGFDAGPSHLTVFNGTGLQTVIVFDSTNSNQFGSVQFQNSSQVEFNQITGINGDATVGANAEVTSSNTSYTGGGMALNGGITTASGAYLGVGRLYVNAGINFAAGSYSSTAIILTGNGQTLPAGFTYPFVYIGGGNVTLGAGPYNITTQLAVQGGSLTLGASLTFPGNTFVEFGGTLILNGHTLSMGGDFTTDQNGVLKMTNTNDSLLVGQNAFFGGASEAGQLTAGGIIFGGNFFEGGGNAQAFVQSGAARSAFINGGAVDSITFSHPGGAGASHFNDLGVGNPQGALKINSDVWILGQPAYFPGAPKIVSGGGQVIHFANMNITGVIFNDVAIAYDAALGGTLTGLDSITFQNYDVNSPAPLIDITTTGAADSSHFLFDHMQFFTDIGSQGGSGHYVRATDSNPGDTSVLIIDINSGLVVSEGTNHTILVGGAAVNWFQP